MLTSNVTPASHPRAAGRAPFRQISLRRLLRDRLKRLYFAIYKLGARFGVYILPVHYYVSEPNIIELKQTVDLWAKPSAMAGVNVDLDEQIDNLRRVCAPYEQEFHGNPHYQHAINQPFQSRPFEVLRLYRGAGVARSHPPIQARAYNRDRQWRSHLLLVSSHLDESEGSRCERPHSLCRARSGRHDKTDG